jgi:hypothetical protein
MRRFALFLAVAAAVLAAMGAVTWWIDPFGEIWTPGALAAARADGCLLSQDLVGSRYESFKLDVFRSRPTRTFVVGSSRVLKIGARPGEDDFSNLGFPGTAPETILSIFRALPAKPPETVYVGVESFWFNASYIRPDTNPSRYTIARYLLSRNAFWQSVKLARDVPFVRMHRWGKHEIGGRCTISRASSSTNWRPDGSRVWNWELDPQEFPKFHETPYRGSLGAWRNGYYDDWTRIDLRRVHVLEQALDLARARGWRVVGFAPPEPAKILRVLRTDPRIAPRWRAFLRLMPRLFSGPGRAWAGLVDGARDGCTAADYPDAFHTNAACSARVRAALDEAARSLH